MAGIDGANRAIATDPVPKIDVRPGSITPDMRPAHAFQLSNSFASDLAAGVRFWPAWIFKAWYDIVLRYRRTAIGPLWVVITTGIMIACLTIIGPILFGGGDPNFIPYMVSGVLSWTYLSISISEATGAFIENAGDIRAVRGPYTAHLFRVVVRNLIIYAHLLIIFVIALIFHHQQNLPNIPLFLLGLILNSIWYVVVGFALAVACSRFRDVQQLIFSVLQVAFLLTPVFWDKTLLLGKSRAWVVHANPLFHLLELIRSPLLGQVPAIGSYLFTIGGIVVGAIVSSLLYRRAVRRIPLWV